MKSFSYIIFVFFAFTSFASAEYWQRLNNLPASHENNYWLDVYFFPGNPDLGWVCGFQGKTLRTTNGGQSWQAGQVSRTLNLESIHFPTPDIGYTSGAAGIYKSIDGGLTWNNITPSTALSLWGTYFYDANYGITLGGGCTFEQQFFITTDGGASWSLFDTLVPNTGLTDAIIYDKDGLAFAVSSGNLWISNDGGKTWDIHKNTGSNVWQEELTHAGNSFLLPYSGTQCTGQGPDGGMRFSNDGGDTWNEYSTGKSMFGAFLINPTTGWACGDDRGVYYTSNSGVDWERRNCGIEQGDLDDIWFNTPVDGWVVGDGIYRLMPDDYLVSKDILNFGDVCPDEIPEESILLTNLSFDISTVDLQLLGDIQDFTVLSNPTFNINSCEDKILTVRFNPTSLGQKNATMRVTFNAGTPRAKIFNVVLTGNSIISTAYPQGTIFEIDPVPVGQVTGIPTGWVTNSGQEQIVSYTTEPSISEITFGHNIPVTIFDSGVVLYFNVFPKDTGWIETTYTMTFGPCFRDTSITIRVYAVSPIIDSEKEILFRPICTNSITDTIEIRNTGNGNLRIDDSFINDLDNEFTFIEWLDSKQESFILQPDQNAFAVINYTVRRDGDQVGEFVIINNDSTKANGNKNPYIIQLIAEPQTTDLFSKVFEINFGDVCINESKDEQFFVYNDGNVLANAEYANQNEAFNIIQPNNLFSIPQMDSVLFGVRFTPDKEGDFIDTLVITSDPCQDTLKVVLKGKGISNEITLSPENISDFVKVGDENFYQFELTLNGNSPVNIDDLILGSIPDGWIFEIMEPDLGVQIQPGETIFVRLRVIATTVDILNSEVCVKVSGLCEDEDCGSIEITANDRGVSVTESVDFGLQTCESTNISRDILIKNETSIQDTISNIYLKSAISEFTLLDLPEFDFLLNGNSNYIFKIQFDANDQEGIFEDTIIVQTKEPGGQMLEIPVRAEFRRTRTILLSPENGNVVANNRYFKDLGIYELCDEPELIEFTIQNTGTLDDQLTISLNSNDAYAVSVTNLNVPANSTATFEIRIEPSLLEQGINIADLNISSEICPINILIELQAELIEPELTFIYDEINFGEVWMETVIQRQVIVRNNSQVARTITSIVFQNNAPVFTTNLEVPTSIEPNDEITFNIIFEANSEGDFSDILLVTEESSCSKITEIEMSGNVPEEKYFIDIALDEHIVDLGDTVMVHMELLQAEQKFQADQYRFDLSFEKKLIFPEKVYVRNSQDEFENIDFNYDYEGNLSFIVENKFAADLMKSTGIISKIVFQTLSYLPDQTDVILNNIDNFTNKDFTYTKKDGSVQITNYCLDEIKHIVVMNPNFNAKFSEVNTGSILNIEINSTGKQTIDIQIRDILGDILIHQNQQINLGENNLQLMINNLSSGVYFISFGSEFGIEAQGKILIVK